MRNRLFIVEIGIEKRMETTHIADNLISDSKGSVISEVTRSCYAPQNNNFRRHQ